jgi:DNA-binding response OmpR family regulator
MTAIRVLVVDDNPDICEVIEAALSQAGCLVRTATKTTEAVILARKMPFDVAVIDIHLRGPTTGIDLASYMSAQGASILFVSGDLSVIHNHDRLDHPLLAKPFRLRDLQTAVASARSNPGALLPGQGGSAGLLRF